MVVVLISQQSRWRCRFLKWGCPKVRYKKAPPTLRTRTTSSTSPLTSAISSSEGSQTSPRSHIRASMVPAIKWFRIRPFDDLHLTFIDHNIIGCIVKLQVPDIHFQPYRLLDLQLRTPPLSFLSSETYKSCPVYLHSVPSCYQSPFLNSQCWWYSGTHPCTYLRQGLPQQKHKDISIHNPQQALLWLTRITTAKYKDRSILAADMFTK